MKPKYIRFLGGKYPGVKKEDRVYTDNPQSDWNSYKTLIENDGFITTEESENALSDFVSENDNVIRWLREAEITEDYLLREPIKMDGYKGLYPQYTAFCISAGEEAKAQKDFSKLICNKYGFVTRTKRINGQRPQVFLKK